METENTSKKGFSATWLIVAAVAAGALYYFFKGSSAAATLINPAGVLTKDTSGYRLGYWAWKIKQNPTWAQATADKARIAHLTPNVQLYQDAQLKIAGVPTPTEDDFNDFVALVDARIAQDTSTNVESVKLYNASLYVVNATAWAAGTKFALPNVVASGNTTATTTTSLTGLVIL